MDRWHHWVDKNCFTESSNRHLHTDVLGPKPKDSLHICGDKAMAQTVEVHRKRGVEAYKLSRTSITCPKSGDETEKQVNTRALSMQIDPSCIQLANREHDSLNKYRSVISGRSSELMVDSVDILVKFDGVLHSRKSPDKDRRIRPVYRRTHRIKFSDVFINGQRHVCALCDCGLFLARKVCCRHIYHIL